MILSPTAHPKPSNIVNLIESPSQFAVIPTFCFIVGTVRRSKRKAKLQRAARQKKTDNVESYVYRDDKDNICLPGEYLRQSIIHAAKYQQDPRSPRKSAMDLVKAGLISLTPLASFGTTKWDYDHAARVQVQRNGITRIRPALREGWKVTILLMVNLPEYLPSEFVNKLAVDAGRLIGVGDFRPSYGRFSVIKFDVLD